MDSNGYVYVKGFAHIDELKENYHQRCRHRHSLRLAGDNSGAFSS